MSSACGCIAIANVYPCMRQIGMVMVTSNVSSSQIIVLPLDSDDVKRSQTRATQSKVVDKVL